MSDDKEIGKVKLKNVRLSFAHVFKPQQGKPDKETGKTPEPRFNCNFLIPKDGDAIQMENLKALKKAKEGVIAKKWPKDPPKFKPEKLCTRDGDQEEYEGYEGMYYVSAGSPENRPPQVIDNRKGGDGKWIRLKESDGKIYSGCYVNAIVKLWVQDNEHGRRVNCSIEVIQFFAHGEAFGAKPVDADEEFDEDDVGEAGSITDEGGDDLI